MAEQKLLAEQQKEKELELQYNKEQEKFKNRWVKSAYMYKPTGPSGWSLFQSLQHEATRSIFTPPWMGC